MNTPISNQPALLLSLSNDNQVAVEPVLVPNDWDYQTESLPFAIGSNQIVITDKIKLRTLGND